jgi:hypothetical protein
MLAVKVLLYTGSYAALSLRAGVTSKEDWQFIGSLAGLKPGK